MSDLWRFAGAASERFSRQAVQYDRFRPRYPNAVFDCIVREAQLEPGDTVVEIGAGTGLATKPFAERGFAVHAVEPSRELRDLARSNVSGPVEFVAGRFEECAVPGRARLVTAFNSWHWVQPDTGVERVAQLLRSDCHLALVWTTVQSWGEPPFEERLADIFGAPWPKEQPHVGGSLEPVASDGRFGELREFRFPFERRLDGPSYVAVTQTYGGDRTPQQYAALERVITDEFDGVVTKREEAVLYLARRL